MLPGSFYLSELDRKLSNMIRVGKIKEINFKDAKAVVDFGDIRTGFIPWVNLSSDKDYISWSPEIGDDVIVLAPSGDIALSVILRTINKNSVDKENISLKLQNGSVVKLNKASGDLDIDIKGSIKLKAGSSVIELTPSGININAPVVNISNAVISYK